MCDERRSPAADPLAELEPVEADYTDDVTEAVAAMEPEEWMPEPPVGSMAPDVALAHRRLEGALNAHLGGGVEVRADGAIVIESRLIMVETGDLLATGQVVIRVRGTPSTLDVHDGEAQIRALQRRIAEVRRKHLDYRRRELRKTIKVLRRLPDHPPQFDQPQQLRDSAQQDHEALSHTDC